VKKFLFALFLPWWLGACRHTGAVLVASPLIDSLIAHYRPPQLLAQNEAEAGFWRSRIDPSHPGYLNESRYAACLALEFRLTGQIDSLRKADSILVAVDSCFGHREASVDLALVAHYITEHRFRDADSVLTRAKQLGVRPYEGHASSFDVDFERGAYFQARAELASMAAPNDYGYRFRKSKLDHFDGRLDSAIAGMDQAARLGAANEFLQGAAVATAGDLRLHADDAAQARDAYLACVRKNGADYHSWLGLGWIALVHDGNTRLADSVFQFVLAINPLPDPLFRLAQSAGQRGDMLLQMQFAREFAARANRPVYGRMYHKYLIQLDIGVLHDAAAGEAMAKEELANRATPQTYAWYCRALLANGKKDEAFKLYQQKVSGQPLEALELYWMGQLMEATGKNYDAKEFYKAAYKTRYDLDPADAADIRKKLEE
jgi:tetratricopeptide (TPR) repeat protein